MNKTNIEWCDMTWNPVTGCLHNCEYCYARGIAHRFAGFEPRCGGELIADEQKKYGENSIWNSTHGEKLHVFSGQPKKRTKAGQFQSASFPYDFEPTLHLYRLGEPADEKKPQNIFVGSMTDLFGEWCPSEWIKQVFDACEAASQHNYLFLTKNPQRYLELAQTGLLPRRDNFWYGTSTPTEDVPFFWAHGFNTFISIEPILGPFNEQKALTREAPDWIIIGAMSGPGAEAHRPERAWIEEIYRTARHDRKPVFMKNSLAAIWDGPLICEYPEGLRKEERP